LIDGDIIPPMEGFLSKFCKYSTLLNCALALNKAEIRRRGNIRFFI
jgi:hypothetical protein